MRRSRSFAFLLFLAVFATIQLSSTCSSASEEAGVAVVKDDWEVEEGDDVYVGDGEEEEQAAAAEDVDESDVLVLTADNFTDTLKKHDYILVEFYAPWCGHCKELKPEYAKAATILKKESAPVVLAKVDGDEHKDLVKQFGVGGFPTLLWFEKGKKKDFKGEREADGIVEWVKGRLGSATVRVNSVEEARDFLKANTQYVAGYFSKLEGEAFEAFEGVAKDEDGQKFALTTSSEVAELLQIPEGSSVPAIILVKPEDERLAVFDGPSDSEELAKFVLAHKMPLVIPFTPKYSQRIFSSGVPRLLLLFATKEDAEKMKGMYSEVAKTVKGKVLCITVDLEDEAVDNVKNFFSISTKEPRVFGYRAFGEVGEQYRFDEGEELTVESVKRFAKRFGNDEVPISYKSEDLPESNDGPVKVVVGKSIDQIVLDDSKDVLLEVYMTTCPHCQKLAPIYFNLAKRFSKVGSLVIAKINGELNDHPLIRVEGYPTVKLFPAGKKNESIDFSGEKDLAGMTRFLKENVAVPFTLERKPVEPAVDEEQVVEQKTDDKDADVKKDEL